MTSLPPEHRRTADYVQALEEKCADLQNEVDGLRWELEELRRTELPAPTPQPYDKRLHGWREEERMEQAGLPRHERDSA